MWDYWYENRDWEKFFGHAISDKDKKLCSDACNLPWEYVSESDAETEEVRDYVHARVMEGYHRSEGEGECYDDDSDDDDCDDSEDECDDECDDD